VSRRAEAERRRALRAAARLVEGLEALRDALPAPPAYAATRAAVESALDAAVRYGIAAVPPPPPPPAGPTAGVPIGSLTPLERIPGVKHGHAKWLCRCACGKSATVRATLLRRGKVRACPACANAAKGERMARAHRARNPPAHWIEDEPA